MVLKSKNRIFVLDENDIEFLMSVYNRFFKTWSVFVYLKSGKTLKILSNASPEEHQKCIDNFITKAKTFSIERFFVNE